MTKHTPGPWEADATGPKSRVRCVNGFVIADAYNSAADARLIAAAPELYEALKELVRFLEPVERDGGLNVPGLATLNRHRAALAKVQP